jgi:hypothetical protein
MSKFFTRPAADLGAVAANAGINVSDLETANYWVTGTFVGTLQVQVSPDNVNWVNQGSALTAPGTISIPASAQYVRGNCTAYTSGTISGVVTGVDDDQKG